MDAVGGPDEQPEHHHGRRSPFRGAAVKTAAAAGRSEHLWPVALAILVAAGRHVALPAQYRVNSRWAVPVVLLVLLAALVIGDPGRIDPGQKPSLWVVTGIVIAFITVANLATSTSSGST